MTLEQIYVGRISVHQMPANQMSASLIALGQTSFDQMVWGQNLIEQVTSNKDTKVKHTNITAIYKDN